MADSQNLSFETRFEMTLSAVIVSERKYHSEKEYFLPKQNEDLKAFAASVRDDMGHKIESPEFY